MLGETEEVAIVSPATQGGKMAAPGQLAAIDLRKEEEWEEGQQEGGLWRVAGSDVAWNAEGGRRRRGVI